MNQKGQPETAPKSLNFYSLISNHAGFADGGLATFTEIEFGHAGNALVLSDFVRPFLCANVFEFAVMPTRRTCTRYVLLRLPFAAHRSSSGKAYKFHYDTVLEE
jgi:hypothetical protein